MSNQVYSSSQRRYIPIPGLNTYTNGLVPAVIPVRISGNGSATVPSVTEIHATSITLEQVPGFTSFEDITGRLVIDEHGIYSIGVQLDVQGGVSDTVDVDVVGSLILHDTGDGNSDTYLDASAMKAAAPGAGTPGNIHHSLSLHYVGYLKKNATISINVSNYANSLAGIPAAGCILKVGKFI